MMQKERLDYETIELSAYTRSGEGGTAVTYKHKELNRLAKLYNPGYEADMARQEFLSAKGPNTSSSPGNALLRASCRRSRSGKRRWPSRSPGRASSCTAPMPIVPASLPSKTCFGHFTCRTTA